MSLTLAHYRLPIASAPLIGHLRVVIDRNGKIYLDGSRIRDTAPSGEFLVITLQNEQVYYVKSSEYASLGARYRGGRKK
jgi:hypothetical protein